MSSMPDSEADMFSSSSMGTNQMDSPPPLNDSMEIAAEPVPSDNESEDGVAPAEVLKQMNEIWLNELASPTLLPHHDEVVQALLQCVRDMEQNFTDFRDQPQYQLQINIHQMEVHRLNYIINDYLRKRLEKIDTYPEQIKLEDATRLRDQGRELLSNEERDYVNKRLLSDRAMMNKVFLNHLPEVLRTLEAPGQDLSIERVFLQVNSKPVNGISMPDMKEPDSEYLIDLQPRSRHLLPFLSVREALEENKVRLM